MWALLLLAQTVPNGHVIERVSPDDVTFPMFGAFDDRGRLFVAESSGLDLYAEITAGTRKCRVKVLEDRDGDGKFETSRVYADQLVFPMGLAWRDGKLYVADPPDLVTVDDAGRRTVLLTGFGHKDNGSLHGVTFGPDGMLYLTMGDPDSYKLKRRDGSTVQGTTGALIRCRPDGSDPEVLCSGFENLVEIVFLPDGEIIGTDNWFQRPSDGMRDALVHLVPGGIYPRHPEKTSPLPRLGDPLPPVALFPAVALSGLVLHEGKLYSAQHNARKVGRHTLTRSGSTFRSADEDFVTSDDPDFHPSDVFVAPDGSLIVIDTGSWYVHHCPTGRIRRSPAKGGIYRVRGPKSAPAVPVAWTQTDEELRKVLTNLKTAAMAARALSGRGVAADYARLLQSDAPEIRLAGAQALAQAGKAESIPALVDALAAEPDRIEEHALAYALFRLADEPAVRSMLNHSSARTQKTALFILDARNTLTHEPVVERVTAADSELRQAALGILQRHPGWAKHAIALVRGWLEKPNLSDEERRGLRSSILAFQSDAAVQDLVGASISKNNFILETAALTSLAKLPKSWGKALGDALENPELRLQAIRTASVLQVTSLDDALGRLAESSQESAAVRVEALRAIVARRAKLSEAALDLLVGRLKETDPLARLASAEVLRRAHLTEAHFIRVLQAARGDVLMTPSAFLPGLRESSENSVVPDILAESIRAGWAPAEQELSQAFAFYPQKSEMLRGLLRRNAAAKLAEFEPLLAGGGAERGRNIYFGNKVACATCHRIGGAGGQIGPDLTKIGVIRAGRDILESILLPSSSFAQGYESYLVATNDGRTAGGVIARQTSDALVLRDSSGAEVMVRKDQIKEMKRSAISIMPEGLERGLTRDEFRDLLTFLQSLK